MMPMILETSENDATHMTEVLTLRNGIRYDDGSDDPKIAELKASETMLQMISAFCDLLNIVLYALIFKSLCILKDSAAQWRVFIRF